jgi:hypothetical protein
MFQMKIIQSPERLTNACYSATLFLAGGISNCPDWQKEMSEIFKQFDGDLIVFNPRRVGDLAPDGETAKEQILWEHRYLSFCDNILFWFPKETVCPITLFELGKYAQKFRMYDGKHIFVGTHPEYTRRFDLEIQLPLIFPDIKLHNNLYDLFNDVVDHFKLESYNGKF